MGDETRQMLAEAEEMVAKTGKSKAAKKSKEDSPSTRTLIASSEKMLNPEASKGSGKLILIILAVLIVGGIGLYSMGLITP